VTDEQLSIMQRESATPDREFRVIKESYGLDHFDLVLDKRYLGRMLANAQFTTTCKGITRTPWLIGAAD
jgi:hypothetical protein